MSRRRTTRAPSENGRRPLWYKDAIIYQTHVRAFFDSDADGIGDFAGLAQKLDYLLDLGVTAIWLLPFYPSPLKDDGYDIADYEGVHPAYGTLASFKTFLREAHGRGLQVITELVINHTSDQHPWFQRARRAPPGSPARDFYVWSESPDRYREARIIFQDFESSNWSWDPIAKAYYWHRFYAHQPDLNFESAEVRRAVFGAMDFWLGLGVDGLRLDAVPYLYEREGSNCENLPETHAFLKELRRRVDERFDDRMLLAEANQWPEDAVAYFGNGDECHMAFHFPVMPRMFMAIRQEDRFPILETLSQTPAIPEPCQWALFLRNHDELTLEMVTDEERDYMYRAYAQDPQMRINLGIRRRLAPLLGNDRKRIELMHALLLSLPGTPVLYYGDEIGMGDNIWLGDRNGVRTPMQWSADRNAGFSRASSQRLYLPVITEPEYHYEAVNVEARQNNPHSQLWWMKRLIALRKRFRAFGRGATEFLYSENRRVLAFVRRHEEEKLLVVANLSRFSQYASVDLSRFEGHKAVELFGRTEFPPIGREPWVLTLGPHAFFWFELSAAARPAPAREARPAAAPVLAGGWHTLARERGRPLENLLPGILATRRWFAGKAREIKSARVVEAVSFGREEAPALLLIVDVEYAEGDPETYSLPVASVHGPRMAAVERDVPEAILARIPEFPPQEPGLLVEAVADPECAAALFDLIHRRRKIRGSAGEVAGVATRALKRPGEGDPPVAPSRLLRAEQSNTSLIFGESWILKLYRRLEEGTNPEWEIGGFLTERTELANVPRVAGTIEYRRARGAPTTLALLQRLVRNEGNAWSYTTDALRRFYERALMHGGPPPPDRWSAIPPAENVAELPPDLRDVFGNYPETARRLGRHTAELHLALASDPERPDFAPEPLSTLYQRSIYQSMRNSANQVLELVKRRLSQLSPSARDLARRLLENEEALHRKLRRITERRLDGQRIRIHGDLHLGQVLYTGKDFVLIDFEGEPARPLSWRKLKRSPLRDVAGMLRSFHYAAYSELFGQDSGSVVRPEDRPVLEPWARFWVARICTEFLGAYREAAGGSEILPSDGTAFASLLEALMLEKAVYEVGYELASRPEWVLVPLLGVLDLLEAPA